MVGLPEQRQIEALTVGDITAFEMLFRTYYQPLCNYAYTFLQDKEAEVMFYSEGNPGVYLKAKGKGIYNKKTKTFTVSDPEPNVTAKNFRGTQWAPVFNRRDLGADHNMKMWLGAKVGLRFL